MNIYFILLAINTCVARYFIWFFILSKSNQFKFFALLMIINTYNEIKLFEKLKTLKFKNSNNI